MADGLTVPGVGDVSTDEVDVNGQGVKHVQYVKLAGGANGDTNPIPADPLGVLASGAKYVTFAVISIADGSNAAYTTGDVIGSPVYMGRYPSGAYLPLGYFAQMGGAVALPDLSFVFMALPATPDGDPAAEPSPGDIAADGSPYVAASSFIATNSQIVDVTGPDWVDVPYTATAGQIRSASLWTQGGFNFAPYGFGPGLMADVWGFAVIGETGTFDFTGGLSLQGALAMTPTIFHDVTYP